MSTSFVNDVVVTKRAAWFTDSMRAFLYKVPIGPNGELGTPEAVPLTGDIVYQSGFNVNGIDATPNGKKLIIVQSNTGKLFKVNRSGVARLINLGGATVTGDGLLLHGKRLYAVVRSPRRRPRDQAAAEPPVRHRRENDHEQRSRRPDDDRRARLEALRGQRTLLDTAGA